VISFIEGGVLLSYEVVSAKIYVPFLGASIYVWTSILTVTLMGLALGYRIGGQLSLRQPKKYLTYALATAGVLVLSSTYIAEAVLPDLSDSDIKSAAILSGFVILFVPVLSMGIVSPLIVEMLNQMNDKLASATGLIFGIGTLGGIVVLLITVFTFIPSIGVQNSTFVLGGFLLLATALSSLIKLAPNEEK